MNMNETLNLVRGAVNERNLLPVLTHFHIEDGIIYGGDGKVSIQAPFPQVHDEPITVPGHEFVKAVDRCQGDPVFEFEKDHLKMRSKTRKQRVIKLPLSGQAYSKPITKGDRYVMDDPQAYLKAIRTVSPFVSTDASRPWAMSILHMEDHLYATNNVTMARTPYDWPAEYPIFGLPGFAVDELTRMRLEPKAIWIHDDAIAFEFDDNVWLRSVLYAADWPDVARMMPDCSDLPKLPGDAREVVEALVPFSNDKKMPIVTFDGSKISTLEGQMVAEDSLEGEMGSASFHAIPLQLVLNHATRMDLSAYPKPVPWAGPGLEGLIVGVRL